MNDDRDHEARSDAPTNVVADMRAEIARRMGAPPKRSILDRLLRKPEKKPALPPQPCCIVGVLLVLDRNLALDGLVMELAENTLLFRQASTFVFDRNGAEVSVRFGEHDRRGKIIAVKPTGYLVQFVQPLPIEEVVSLVQTYGLVA